MSFFSKGQASRSGGETPPSSVSSILSTGGKIDEMTLALIGAANDTEPQVRSAISKSLQDIGRRQPDLVLSSCKDFIIKNAKLVKEHRVILLNVMHQVLEMRRDEVETNLCVELKDLAIVEMTKEKDVIPDWQGAASAILVSLCMRFPSQVLEELMKRFSPGSVPHYFIMKSLGDMVIANALDAVPRLKEILARVLPVLASVKAENMKWVFATGMGHFCDAILYYGANIEKASNKSLTVHSFSSDVFPAYEIMFNNWLLSKESKVRLATIQALGSISAVLTKEQLEAQLPQLVPNILSLYKKEKDQLPITQGFNSLLAVAVKDSRALEPLLPSILATIFPLVCQIPDTSSGGPAVKNYNELLRCFQTIGITFSDTIISFLLDRLSPKDSKGKLGSLAVIRHLITHMEAGMEDKKGVVVSGVKPLVLTETSLPIKQELSQIVIAMASHGYLHLEGGENLVEFIVQNCSISEEEIAKGRNQKSKEAVTLEDLRNLCDSILNLSATTIDSMHDVLWPYLFEVLVPSRYSNALSIVCKCLAHIGNLKREEEADNYIIDFDRAVNLPKPHAIIARLLVMLNAPFRRGELGKNILDALKAIGPVLHPSICDMWDATIPKLINFLKTSADKWNQSTWEDLILRLLSETIKIANDDEWTTNLGEQLSKQIELYQSDADMKRVAFKHLGLILQKSNHKEFIRSKLESMLSAVDDSNELERIGCASGFGYCAATHLDMALEKVQIAPKAVAPKPKGGLFSFMSGSKDKVDTGPQLSSTVILCYGYITAYASPSLITSRIEITIVKNLKPSMPKPKSSAQKECMIKAIDLIGKAMHPSHLKREYIFKQRDELISQLIQYMTPNVGKEKSEVTDRVRIAALATCTTLINLEPILAEEVEKELLERAISFYAVKQTDFSTGNIVEVLNDMLGALMTSQPSIACLCRLFKSIEPYVCSKEGDQRESACKTVLFLLKKFIELNRGGRPEKKFTALGNCMAMLIPRCTDPLVSIRQLAIESIETCLYIDLSLKSETGSLPELPVELQPFQHYKERIVTDELNDQFAVIHEMSHRLLSALVTGEELPTLLLCCLKGLTDPQLASASGTCVVLNGLIKSRGEELKPKVPQIISGLLSSMSGITNEQTMNGTLHAVRNLAAHHELLVIDQLLQAPIPHSTFVVKALQAIAKDENLVMELIHHLFDTINNSQLYDEKIDKKGPIREACHVPMSATCALGELMQLEELEDIVTDNYPLFLSSLLLRIGTANGMSTNDASEQISNTFKQFIQCGKETALEAVMLQDNNWQQLHTPTFHKTVTQIAGAVSKAHRNEMKNIFEFLLTFTKGNFPGQRVVAATVIAEFVSHCKHDPDLLNKLLNCLLTSLSDPTVKLQSLRGLSNIVSVGLELANVYTSTVLDALMASIDDSNETIAMEAMNGLSRVFEMVEEQRMAPVLVNLCHRIHPAFDKENEDIRAAAFNLFGSLHRFGSGNAADIFYEQIHNNLPSLIVHIQDDNHSVQLACKSALRNLAPLFRSEGLAQLLVERLEGNKYLDYPEFLNDLSQVLIDSFPERLNHYVMASVEYFTSTWNCIKANAASFVGFLMGNLPVEKRKLTNLNPSLISKALILLLKEKAPEVRGASANAMSLLFHY